jgi:hypothetical protein
MKINIKELISEFARRNPQQNPKIDWIEVLEYYKDDENSFITFTDIDKLGINPIAKHTSPIGVYAYPVVDMWVEIKDGNIPYGANRKHCWLFTPTKSSRILNDIGSYSYNALQDDILILKEMFNSVKGEESLESSLGIAEHLAKSEYPFEILWEFTRHLSGFLYNHPELYKQFNQQQSAWRHIFAKVLMYDAIIDRTGTEIIHHNEPKQGVFFFPNKLTLIEKIK